MKVFFAFPTTYRLLVFAMARVLDWHYLEDEICLSLRPASCTVIEKSVSSESDSPDESSGEVQLLESEYFPALGQPEFLPYVGLSILCRPPLRPQSLPSVGLSDLPPSDRYPSLSIEQFEMLRLLRLFVL